MNSPKAVQVLLNSGRIRTHEFPQTSWSCFLVYVVVCTCALRRLNVACVAGGLRRSEKERTLVDRQLRRVTLHALNTFTQLDHRSKIVWIRHCVVSPRYPGRRDRRYRM